MLDRDTREEIVRFLSEDLPRKFNFHIITSAGTVLVGDVMDLMPAEDPDTAEKVEGPYVLLRGQRPFFLGVKDPTFNQFMDKNYMVPWSAFDHSEPFITSDELRKQLT